MIHHFHISDRLGDIALAAAGSSAAFGTVLGPSSQTLQQAAYVVAIVSGTFAAIWYSMQIFDWIKRKIDP